MELRSQRRRRLCHDNKWGELPRELLDLIAQNLATAHDFCRFGAVCTSWHKAAVQANYNPNADHQVPWFMTPLPRNMKRSGSSSTRIKPYMQHRFYDLCSGRSHKLRLPVAPTSRIVGTNRGWLLTHEYRSRKVRLLNPLKGAKFYTLFLTNKGEDLVKIFCLSGSPSNGLYTNFFHDMPLVQQRRYHSLHALESLVPFKGHFYGVNCTRNMLFVVDKDNSDGSMPLLLKDFAVLPPRHGGRYTCTLGTRTILVSGVDDLLLCVTTLPINRCWKWQVYRVEMEEDGRGKLVRMWSLGDGAVFISDKSSHYVSRLPNSSRGADGCNCKRNSIYFHCCNIFIKGEVVIWEYSLEDDVTKPFYRYRSSDLITNPSVWVVPNLW